MNALQTSTCVVDKNTGHTLLENLECAGTLKKQTIGLIGRDDLPVGHGLFFPRCNNIHTCFMRFDIDVVYLDHEKTVIKTVTGMKPWRLSVCRGACGAIETRAGWIVEQNISKGFIMQFVEKSEVGQ